MNLSFRAVSLALCAIGMAIAGYLVYTDMFGIEPACGAGGGCSIVHTSEYARLLGIPVFHIGLAGYVLLTVTSSLRGTLWRLISVAVAVMGLAFSLYLQYRSFVTLNVTCIWCMSSAATIFALTIVSTARYILEEDAPASF